MNSRRDYFAGVSSALVLGLVFLSGAAQEPSAVHKRFTNADVIDLVRMNLSEDVIVSKIRTGTQR